LIWGRGRRLVSLSWGSRAAREKAVPQKKGPHPIIAAQDHWRVMRRFEVQDGRPFIDRDLAQTHAAWEVMRHLCIGCSAVPPQCIISGAAGLSPWLSAALQSQIGPPHGRIPTPKERVFGVSSYARSTSQVALASRSDLCFLGFRTVHPTKVVVGV